MSDALDKFGELVVTQLRDRALEFFDMLAAGKWKAPRLLTLQDELAGLSDEQRRIVRRCVVDAVDVGMHDFLFALVTAHDFDEGIEVLVDGENVVELSDQLNGEQFGENGWIARFGKYSQSGELVRPDE
jgi:hypothetical protein